VAALARPGAGAGSAAVAAALAGSARRVPIRALTAAGLLAAAVGFCVVSLAGSAVARPLVLALVCLPAAGGLAAALAGTLRATSAGGAACGLVLLVTGVLAGYLAAGAVRLQALGQARTVATVHAALITTSVRWALVAAAVTPSAPWPWPARPGGAQTEILLKDEALQGAAVGGDARSRVSLAAVANHQHPAAGSLTPGKITFPEPGEPASPLSK
jgi:hypothetical protein